jgi:hypothetical protein
MNLDLLEIILSKLFSGIRFIGIEIYVLRKERII